MSKKPRKKKKTTAPDPAGGFKRFLHDLKEAMTMLGKAEEFAITPLYIKQLAYVSNWQIKNPVAAHSQLSSNDLVWIGGLFKMSYRNLSIDYEGVKVTIYQLQLLLCYTTAVIHSLKNSQAGDALEKLSAGREVLFDKLHPLLSWACLLHMVQLSAPDQQYYYVAHKLVKSEGPRRGLAFTSTISWVPACKRSVVVNGYKRPAFRLAKIDQGLPFEWHSVDAAALGTAYTGDKQRLDVYIQSHALRRLEERLDLLKHNEINLSLWQNTLPMENFISYGNYFLLPYEVNNVKVGYLVAHVVDDMLLFRTFLFVTHIACPEGDRLKTLSGLDKYDITYWRIDRLSTFVNLDENEHPALRALFDEAGLGELMQLRTKNFKLNDLEYAAKLDGLADYIKLGQETLAEEV